jgi:pSer/pThr/pTyr-binding forkhead associated (FHA) protein
MKPRLLVIGGPRRGSGIHLSVDEVTVGRHSSNKIVISDPALSRRHFSILKEAGVFRLRDLGSRNGTFVNDERVRECILEDGDQVRTGGSNFVVLLSDTTNVAESGTEPVSLDDLGYASGEL